MGERGNIVILDHDDRRSPVILYTHWQGHRLEEIVREALDSPAGRGRLSDGWYLARIIFEHLRAGCEDTPVSKRAIDYGIGTSLCDNNYPIWVVDPVKQTVAVVSEAAVRDEGETSARLRIACSSRLDTVRAPEPIRSFLGDDRQAEYCDHAVNSDCPHYS